VYIQNFRIDAAQIVKTVNKRVCNLATSTQVRATCHTDTLEMAFIPPTGVSRYHNSCIDGGASWEYFGYLLVIRG
jgi:hypothetical protein